MTRAELPRNRMQKRLGFRAAFPALLVLLTLGLVGCQTQTRLTPASEAQRVAGLTRAASEERQNVSIVVDAEAWPGDPEIKLHVAPLRVDIQNNSDRPLRVRYSDFALINDSTGDHFAALPPYSIEGSVSERVVARYDSPLSHVGFRHSRFRLSPFYDGLYPEIGYWEHPFHYDPFYYDHYFGFWAEIPLPTEEMLRQVLPEGVIEPGGSLSGFLYFEPVPDDVEWVEFRFDLANANDGDRFGVIEIPFLVDAD